MAQPFDLDALLDCFEARIRRTWDRYDRKQLARDRLRRRRDLERFEDDDSLGFTGGRKPALHHYEGHE